MRGSADDGCNHTQQGVAVKTAAPLIMYFSLNANIAHHNRQPHSLQKING